MTQKTTAFQALKNYLAPIADISGALSLLSWDQETMMPAGGSGPRAQQLGTLARILHNKYTDQRLADLLEAADKEAEPESQEALVVRAVRRQYEKRTRLPEEFVVRRTELSARARETWKAARNENRFSDFESDLAEQFALARELADHLGFADDPYDALLDSFEPGLTYNWVKERFDALRPELVNLVAQIMEAKQGNAKFKQAESALVRRVSAEHQISCGQSMAEFVGYRFDNGRLDLSAHPFTSGSSYLDVRLTTRVLQTFFPSCLFSCIHEAGHGIHGQQLNDSLYRLPFRYGLALAESQSRFYENILGRSRAFWKHNYKRMQAAVPEFSDVSEDEWYLGINSVSPSLIRVEADEVTYGMHIMLRFEIEHAVVNGEMAVSDLPAVWNDKMESYLGIKPESDANGVLQDIHWSQGGIGYFPDYLLGSMLSSQLWDALEADLPSAEGDIESGNMKPINAWMRDNVQQHGGLFTFSEACERSTRRSFSAEPYLKYLQDKYGELYGL
jgi:carboxypeptidase Taq